MEIKAMKINAFSVKAISKTEVPTSQMRDLIARLGFKGQSANYYYGESELTGIIEPISIVKSIIWGRMEKDTDCMSDGSKYLGCYPSLAKEYLENLTNVELLLKMETNVK